MEVDPSCPENFDQLGGSSTLSDQQVPTQTQQMRSYDCTFCKRGFCNAQALGGHMNIHRRDRAKLKEPSTITKKQDPSSLRMESSENKGCTIRQPWRIVAGELRQLQLFVDRPSSSEHHKSGSTDESETHTIAEGLSADKELDLELRLGPES